MREEEEKKSAENISLEDELNSGNADSSHEREETFSQESKEDRMEKIHEQLQEYKAKHLQQLAEMENLRKRMQKERGEMTRFAIENALSQLLAPLDSFENALQFAGKMSDEIKNWAFGFQMILTQLKDVLENNNIQSYDSKGQLFDPHWHEAVEAEETEDHPEGTILEEFIKGYKCGERVLRPARVKVAKQPKQDYQKIKENHKENPNDREEEKQ